MPGPSEVAAGLVDQADLRRANLSRVLRHLRQEGPRSRARIAAETGLTKASVSSLVADLAARGLVRDGEVERSGRGRPGQTVEVAGRVCGLGVEVNVDYVAVHVRDLTGRDVLTRRAMADVPRWGTDATLDTVAELVDGAIARVEREGHALAGTMVAIPGLVEPDPGLVRLAPNLGWRDVPVVAELRARSRRIPDPVGVDNDANLSALAEDAMGSAAGTGALVYLTGEVGVGAGILTGGQLLRGAHGFGGEVGHMVVSLDGPACGCGRRGCWETLVGLTAMLRLVADPHDPVTDPTVDLEQRIAEIRRRAETGDPRTVTGLHTLGSRLGLGASILANIVDPEVIVLGGFFALLGDFVMPALQRELQERLVAPPGRAGGPRCRVEASTLGFTAAARGGAHVVLDRVLADPTLIPADPSAPRTRGAVDTEDGYP